MKDEDLKELRTLLADPSVQQMLQAEYAEDRKVIARNLRNEVCADWLENVFQRLCVDIDSNASHRTNSETGRPHTVESITAEYRKKIGLDLLLTEANDNPKALKVAATLDIAISKKQAQELFKKKDLNRQELGSLWQDIKQYISDHLSSHRGYSDEPAIIYDLREVFSKETVDHFDDEIVKEIAFQKEQCNTESIHNKLPKAPLGSPQKVDTGLRENDQLFPGLSQGPR